MMLCLEKCARPHLHRQLSHTLSFLITHTLKVHSNHFPSLNATAQDKSSRLCNTRHKRFCTTKNNIRVSKTTNIFSVIWNTKQIFVVFWYYLNRSFANPCPTLITIAEEMADMMHLLTAIYCISLLYLCSLLFFWGFSFSIANIANWIVLWWWGRVYRLDNYWVHQRCLFPHRLECTVTEIFQKSFIRCQISLIIMTYRM